MRYIHLNPLRAKLVSDMKELGQNRYCWYSVLMGKVVAEWQDTAYILRLFGGKPSIARRRYREFVQKGIAAGRRGDLTGGGLIRSVGGWSAAKALRMAGALQKGDERILGDGGFVEQVLSQAKDSFERKYRLKLRGVRVERIAERVAEILDIDVAQLWAGGKQPRLCAPAVFSAIGRQMNWGSARSAGASPASDQPFGRPRAPNREPE